MIPRSPRRRAEQRGLRLWPVGTVLALAFAAAILAGVLVFFAGWELLGAEGLRAERRLSSSTLFDLVKLSFGAVAGAGALVALVVAYRRQRIDEDAARRDATRLHNERFTTAVSQLGEESAAVRLGGVHALAGLADDAPTRELRQTCIDVLCAYLRLPYTAKADLPEGDADAHHAYLALREVRHTVIRLIRDHLRLPLDHPNSWQGHDLDFTGVVFDGGDFTQAEFSSGTVRFDNARFSGGRVRFDGARFSGGRISFHRSEFADTFVRFELAEFSGGVVRFDWVKFSEGVVSFQRAKFCGSDVRFDSAKFSGSNTTFDRVEFSGGSVRFRYAKFSGGTVSFHRAEFSGGHVDLSNAMGAAPSDLVPPTGSPLPSGLRLPPEWRTVQP